MIKKITIVLLSLVFLLVALKFLYNYIDDKDEWRKTISNMDLSDKCIKNVYINNYLGLSINCPAGLMAIENYNNSKTQKEGVSFVDNTKNIKDYDVLSYLYKFTAFSINIEDEKFNPNNYYERVDDQNNNFKQVDVFNFVKKAEAVRGPIPYKIENIKKIKIGSNEFYTYSYEVNSKREDHFIIPQNDEYLSITFYNQTEDFVNQALSSLKTFEPVRN